MPNKVQSGTFAMVYLLASFYSGPVDVMQVELEPIMQHLKHCKGLSLDNLSILDSQALAVQQDFSVLIVQILLQHCLCFDDSYRQHASLQFPSHRPMPNGHKTRYFPLRAMMIEEATVHGNLAVHEDVYLTQLKLTDEQLSKTAILTINDVLTNQCIHGGQLCHIRDVTPWTRHEVFQISIGLFHLCLNLVWALLHVHRGTTSETGSLSYFFMLLEKTRLSAPHPDYHTLLATLMQVLNGLILDAWHRKSGFSSL